jgi:hypothetical protein
MITTRSLAEIRLTAGCVRRVVICPLVAEPEFSIPPPSPAARVPSLSKAHSHSTPHPHPRSPSPWPTSLSSPRSPPNQACSVEGSMELRLLMGSSSNHPRCQYEEERAVRVASEDHVRNPRQRPHAVQKMAWPLLRSSSEKKCWSTVLS